MHTFRGKWQLVKGLLNQSILKESSQGKRFTKRYKMLVSIGSHNLLEK